jgi:hypothetical protein
MQDHTEQRTGENSCCCNEPDEHQEAVETNFKCIQNLGLESLKEKRTLEKHMYS